LKAARERFLVVCCHLGVIVYNEPFVTQSVAEDVMFYYQSLVKKLKTAHLL